MRTQALASPRNLHAIDRARPGSIRLCPAAHRLLRLAEPVQALADQEHPDE